MSLINKLKDQYNTKCVSVFAPFRRKKLNNHDFSIISNNCWGGYIYRHFAIPYATPTVGLYFFASDYVKFARNLEYYLKECKLKFIAWSDSKYKDVILKKGQTNVPIARLDDIEIIFLHYKTQEEAEEKWNRRAKRVNYNNLIFKFSEMNDFKKEDMETFESLQAQKKIAFVSEQYCNYDTAIVVKNIDNDTRWYETHINLIKLINSKSCEGRSMYGKYK